MVGTRCLEAMARAGGNMLRKGGSIIAPVTLILDDDDAPVAYAIGVPIAQQTFKALCDQCIPIDPVVIDGRAFKHTGVIEPPEVLLVITGNKEGGNDQALNRMIVKSLREWPADQETKITAIFSGDGFGKMFSDLCSNMDTDSLALFPDVVVSRPTCLRKVIEKIIGDTH